MAKMGYAAGEEVAVRDLWSHTENGTVTGSLAYTVQGRGASLLLKLTKPPSQSDAISN
jgi:hypothetical protein